MIGISSRNMRPRGFKVTTKGVHSELSGVNIPNPSSITGNLGFVGSDSQYYQSQAGFTPAQLGSPIGKIVADQFTLTQSVDTKRPLYDNGMSFDGIDDYLATTDTSLFDFERNEAFTVYVKFKANATNANYAFLGRRDPVNVFRGWTLGSPANNKIRFELVNDFVGGNRISVESTQNMGTNWRSAIAVYKGDSDGNTVEMYIDEAAETTSVITNALSATIVAASPLFSVGLYTDGSSFQAQFKGNIRCFGVVNGAIDASGLQQLMNYMRAQ